ncbi:ATP-binding cassette domain-containing protein [Streptomyces sp. NPDC006654]|uniref:ATP-binding cassette domain-containing protein n=1 Tax=Streptomyces sp. NPDC006654 TaxID=3156897 RepID=UPI003403E9E6
MIEAFGLTSNPRKAHPPAVDDVTFEARAGHVTALLGEAGAGKTTTLRLMLELQQGRGITQFRGRPLHRMAHPSREVGVLLGDVAGHPGRTVRGHLRMLCAATGVPARRADEVLEAIGIVSLRDEPLGTLSRGMDRRLGLACALLPDPHTLVLDEPTKGLAGREAHWLHRMLRAYTEQGGTVLFTTADPKEAARAADRVVTLDAGRLVADQEVTEFARTRLRPRVAVRSPHAARLAALLSKEARTAHRSVEVVREGGNRLSVYGSTTAEVGETAFRHGILVHQLADETGDMGPGADAEPLTGPVREVVRGVRDASEPGTSEECRPAGKALTDDPRDEPGRELQRAAGSPVTPQPRASATAEPAARSRRDDDKPAPSGLSRQAEPTVTAAHRSPASAEARPDDLAAESRTAHASIVTLEAQPVTASAGPRPSADTAPAHGPSPAASPDPTACTTSPDQASATVPAQPPAATTPAQPPGTAAPVRLPTAPASAQPSAAPSAHRPTTTADQPPIAAPSPHQPTAAAVGQPSDSAGPARRSTPAATAQPTASAGPTATSQPREVSAHSPIGAEPNDSAPRPSSRPQPRAVPGKDPAPAGEPLHQPQPGKPTTTEAEAEVATEAETKAVFAPPPAAPAHSATAATAAPAHRTRAAAPAAHRAEVAAPDVLSPLPPAISVRSAPSPLRPLRYELRRASGIGAGFVTCGAVLLLSALTSVLLARLGHTSQDRLFAAWPQELPLPPAALGAGLLGALSFGDEFRHPALAADRGTVPRRLGLLTAKLLVSGATAVLLSFLTLGCDAEALYLVYGQELAKVPADWLALTVSWFGLVVGCSWAGVLAAGVFRSTAAGLAAVLAVPVLVVPAVHQALRGPGARLAIGLPMRLREAFLLQWPFGGERYLVGAVRVLAQPVGGALALSLSALLGAYLFTTLRARVR